MGVICYLLTRFWGFIGHSYFTCCCLGGCVCRFGSLSCLFWYWTDVNSVLPHYLLDSIMGYLDVLSLLIISAGLQIFISEYLSWFLVSTWSGIGVILVEKFILYFFAFLMNVNLKSKVNCNMSPLFLAICWEFSLLFVYVSQRVHSLCGRMLWLWIHKFGLIP